MKPFRSRTLVACLLWVPLLAGLRASAQLISYEISMGLALLGAVMMAGSLSLTDIVHAQGDVWYVIPQIIGFLC